MYVLYVCQDDFYILLKVDKKTGCREKPRQPIDLRSAVLIDIKKNVKMTPKNKFKEHFNEKNF